MDNYIKIDGTIDTKIRISQEQAFEVLYEDCCNHSKNLDETNEESVKIFESLKTLTKYYSKIVGEEKTLTVPCIFYSEKMEFAATSMDILKALYLLFIRGKGNLLTSKMIDEVKARGVYSYWDVSYHGSPDYEYSLIYPGIRAEETYDALNYLYSHYNDYLNKQNDLTDNNKPIIKTR